MPGPLGGTLESGMNTTQIKSLIGKEIEWCLDHPAENLSKQFQKGFVSGLQQAINLIDGAAQHGVQPTADHAESGDNRSDDQQVGCGG